MKLSNKQPSETQSCLPSCGCWPVLFIAAILGLFSAIYFFGPGRINFLILGVDRTPEGSNAGRSDTNILVTFVPIEPKVGMLSIPRDLWVNIPGYGENRINTAHFFAEAANPGSGPKFAIQTVEENFGVTVPYYLRIKFDGFKDVIDAMGGVVIDLDQSTAGYEAGRHRLNGQEALAFARIRTDSDDFFRMSQGQMLLKSAFTKMLSPLNWWRFPAVFTAVASSVDTNLPIWLWPRLGFVLLRVGPSGIDNRIIGREMVIPTVTSQGANVLLPMWDQINPVLFDLFGQ